VEPSDAERTPAEFFAGSPDGYELFRVVERAVVALGTAEVVVTKSQIAFRRRRGFAFVWRPAQYVKSNVPAVLALALPHEVKSGRFKSVVHPSTRVWMHHLELRHPEQVDAEVLGWLADAYDNGA
jgi:hypothetical protein